MFLPQSQLETVLLKRLEHLRSVQNAPALGMCHCLSNALQALNSAAGIEWSSTDGTDECQQENIQVDVTDTSLSSQLSAWEAWLAVDRAVAKAKYYAATHALIQDILSCIIVGSSEPIVSRTALDAAWEEDAGNGSQELPSDRFKSSLAALATTCSSDGTPQTAAACLLSLLTRLQEEQKRWQRLVEQYAMEPAREAEAGGDMAVVEAGGGDSTTSAPCDDSNDDLDALLEEADEAGNTAPDSGLPAAATAAIDASVAASGDNDDGDNEATEDGDETISLGLSRAASQTSTAPCEENPDAGPLLPRRAARAISTKSVEDPELRRALSDTSSANLDDLPPEDLEELIERQGSHMKSSTRLARQPASSSGGVHGDVNLGHLADMDLRAWAALKDKQQPVVAPKGRPVPSTGLAPLLGRGDAAKPVIDQHSKATRSSRSPGNAPAPGPGGNSLHTNLLGNSPVRQSLERDRGAGGALGNDISRYGSNDSPLRPRSRSIGANLSRKLSISEPGPMGPQAEWKHLPALGQATRLHPHEMRQQSYGTSRASGQSRGRGECAMALVDDKLPSLPALAGARGQPPKAMEFLRRPSMVQRGDAHHADTGPNAHLPGLGQPGKLAGGGQRGRALCVHAAKKSFRGDDNF